MTTAQWLTGAGIGVGTGTVLLVLLKLAIDGPPAPDYWATRKPSPARAPALPSRAPSHRRHAAPAFPRHTETLPLRVQQLRARHSKDTA
ncbi:hypothetical protein [Streptomyces sp. NPDC048385]|uniref:hypothetical protein n=1 Tax=unclassified Streptomyces TaxID=2593676 RepID=UPI003439802E